MLDLPLVTKEPDVSQKSQEKSQKKSEKIHMGKGMPGVQLLKSGYASGLFVCTPLGQHTVFIIDQKILKNEGIACFWKFVFTK